MNSEHQYARYVKPDGEGVPELPCGDCKHHGQDRRCPTTADFLSMCSGFEPKEGIDEPADTTVNPKELAGSKKPATWSVMPRWIVLLVGRVMTIGARKYGAFNYRESAIAASTYQDAIERHAALWFDGEDNDAETGVSHLASLIASCALLLDAQATGKLTDDRQKTGIVRRQLDMLEALIAAENLTKKVEA